MPEQSTLTLADAMGRWHEFYALLGTASATLVGLLFVAATIGSGVFSSDRRAPMRAFLSATLVHFSSILAACLMVLAPVGSWLVFGVLIACGGGVGLIYCGLVFRDMVREGLSKRIDLEDRTWYVAIPLVGYLLEAAAGVMLASRLEVGRDVLAMASGLLMLVGVHNAWDITIWLITRRPE
jgi:hypothetical protein